MTLSKYIISCHALHLSHVEVLTHGPTPDIMLTHGHTPDIVSTNGHTPDIVLTHGQKQKLSAFKVKIS